MRVKLFMEIDKDVKHEAKIIAVKKNITLTQYIEDAIRNKNKEETDIFTEKEIPEFLK